MAFQTGSGGSSGGGSGCSEDRGGNDSHNVRKNYHRHTPEQIQRLEAFYKECPHPDENQRRQLGRELSLEPRQIKFWFQNKRTQTKAQNERADNNTLRLENDKIRCENLAIREALKNVMCPSCGAPSFGEEGRKQNLQKLKQENAQLKLEHEKMSNILATYMGRPLSGASLNLPETSTVASGSGSPAFEVGSLVGNINADNLIKSNPGIDKSLMAEIAASAMDELIKLIRADQPLWVRTSADDQYILDRESYERITPRSTGLRYLNSRMESSKDSGIVIMEAKSFVDLYLDPDKWIDLFPTVVSKARTTHVLEAGFLGNRSGTLQLISEQMHILSPLIQARDFYILRYCQLIEAGTWVIVDISYDCLRGDSHVSPNCCWKHPSGCMIQEMPNGLSKVTCVEHVEVDDNYQLHPLYEGLVKSGLGFGAKKWIMTLQRACERFSYMVEAGRTGRELGGGRRSMIMLACRMVKSYSSIFSLLRAADFRELSELTNNRIQLGVRKNTCPGQPVGIIVSASSSCWVPASPLRVFKYLSDNMMRSQWDVLCNGSTVREVMQIPTGRHSANRISVLQPLNSGENITIFQESMVDHIGSLIVYAPIDTSTMSELATGSDSTLVPILASGFSVVTDGSILRAAPSNSTSILGTGGSLLTMAFQILACSSLSTEDVAVDVIPTIDAFVTRAVRVITSALNCSG